MSLGGGLSSSYFFSFPGATNHETCAYRTVVVYVYSTCLFRGAGGEEGWKKKNNNDIIIYFAQIGERALECYKSRTPERGRWPWRDAWNKLFAQNDWSRKRHDRTGQGFRSPKLDDQIHGNKISYSITRRPCACRG